VIMELDQDTNFW